MTKTIVAGLEVRQGSDLVIPAVPGEFYAYSAEFMAERPLYALMKCKANKARPRDAAAELGSEANLLFLLGDVNQIQVCAVGLAHSLGLLGGTVSSETFGENWIALAGITVEKFLEISSCGDVGALTKICRVACAERETSLLLTPGTVAAVMTSGGKYGLFYVKELTLTSIKIDACHILI